MPEFYRCERCGASVRERNREVHEKKCVRTRKRANPRRRYRRSLFDSKLYKPVMVVVVVVLLAVAAVAFWPTPPKKLSVGDAAPEIIWSTGKLSDYQGKVILINFMDTDCSYCQREAPHLSDLWEKWVGEPEQQGDSVFVEFLSVDVNMIGEEDTEQDLWEWKATYYPSPWQHLLDNGEAKQVYSIRGTPTTYILGPDLVIRHIFVGYQGYAVLNNAIGNTLEAYAS